MRVLMLSWEYPPHVVGGLARHTYHLAHALREHGVEVHVLTLGRDGDPPFSQEDGVLVHRTPSQRQQAPDFTTTVMQFNITLLEQSVQIWQEKGPFDLIHAHDWLVAPVARSLKHLYHVPLVATVHALEHGRHGGLHTPQQHYISQIEWELTYQAWRVILCSEFMKEDLQSFFGLPQEKIAVIPNGIAVGPKPNFVPVDRRKPMVLFVGRLVPEKGVSTLLSAMPTVLESCPQAWCVVAGTGPMAEELRALAGQLGIAERVVFTGYVDDHTLTSLYRTARVAVFPSHYEPFGIVALEAMAGGAPTIVADAGGLREIVEHQVNGVKVQPGHEELLADEIIGLIHDSQRGQQLVDEAYQSLIQRFSWSEIARSTRSVYREVCVEHSSSNWRKDAPVSPGKGTKAWGRLAKRRAST